MTSISQIQIGLRPHTQPSSVSGQTSSAVTAFAQSSSVVSIKADTMATALKARTLRFNGTNTGLNPDSIIDAIPTATDWQMTAILTGNQAPRRSSQVQPEPHGTVVSFIVNPYIYGIYSMPGQLQPILTATRVNGNTTNVGESHVVELNVSQRDRLQAAVNTYGRPVLATQIGTDARKHLASGNGSWRYTQAAEHGGHEALSFRSDGNQYILTRQTQPVQDGTIPLPFTPSPYVLSHTRRTSGESFSVPLTEEEYKALNQQWRTHALPAITSAHGVPTTFNVNPQLAELTRLVWHDSPFVHLEQSDERPHEIRITTLPPQQKMTLVTSPHIIPMVTANPTSRTAPRLFILNTEHPDAMTLTLHNPPHAKLQRRLEGDEAVELGRLLRDVASFKLARRDHGLRHIVVRALADPPEAESLTALEAVHRGAFPGIPFHPNPVEQATQAELLAERIERLIPDRA